MKDFVNRFNEAYAEKKSVLCVGLDPAVVNQRKNNFIPENQDRLNFMLDMIDKVYSHCVAIKPNRQYLIGLSVEDIQHINKLAHDYGLLSIIDHKLTDIGSTNDSALYWIAEEGFDGLTFSPFAGNTKSTCEKAHEYGLGVITLTLMSNHEAKWMITEKLNNKPAYIHFAEEVSKYADAAVVGTTGHVTTQHIEKIKEKIGKKLILAPGVGAQGGDAEKLIKICDHELLINVGRAIIYSDNPVKNAEKYNDQFNEYLKNI